MKKQNFKNSYLLYTGSFVLLISIVFLPFIIKGRSFVWNIDGINQHYPILFYYGNLLKNFLMGQGFPMVDFNLGLGFDTLTTLHYYVLGDPIALLSVFTTKENTIFIYNILILLRFYLAGVSYLLFCRYWGKDGHSIILGALFYVFCGYALFSGVRHPYFLNPMIYLPLIIIGLEKVLRRKKPYLLIIMVFISTISNFYFLFSLTVIAVIYVIFRYFSLYRKTYSNNLIGMLLTGFRTAGYYLLGIAMAAFVFLPILYAFSLNGRFESKAQLLISYLHYNKAYYLRLLQGVFASGVTPGYWVQLSFPSIFAISIAIILCNKKYNQLRIVFIISISALFVPAFGYFMNGFSYVTNRWTFLISFIAALLFTMTYDKILEIKNTEKALLVFGILGYGIMAFAFPAKFIVKCTFLILILTFATVIILQMKRFAGRQRLREVSLYLLIIFNLGFNGFAFYSTQFNSYVDEFLTKDEIENLSGREISSLINDIKDDSFYRIETYGDVVRNEALLIGFHDVSGYYSLMDGNVTTYYKQLELLNQRSAYRFDNHDNRTIINALASVKYLITTDKTAAPYAYKRIKEETFGLKTYYLFKNLFALPLGYTYENYMLEEDYNKLNVFEKQNALMNAVILSEENHFIDKTKQDMGVDIEKLDITILPDENITLGDNSIEVLRAGANIILKFKTKPKSETYIRFDNLVIDRRSIVASTFKVKGEKEAIKYGNVRNIYHNSYFGKTNFLINTGYSKIERTWAKITFLQKETYQYDNISVYNVGMKQYEKQVSVLNKSALRNINQSNNFIEGDITLGKKGIMVLSIPFSKGWRGYVDGEKVELLKGNVMYTALLLNTGEHHIILKYETPYLKVGTMISIIAFLIFIGIIIYNKTIIRKL